MGQLSRKPNNTPKRQPRPSRKTFPTIGKLLYYRRQVSSLKPGECYRYRRETLEGHDFGQSERPGWTVPDLILEGIPGATFSITCRMEEDSVTFCRLREAIKTDEHNVRAHVLPDSRERVVQIQHGTITITWTQAIDGLWYRQYVEEI